MSKSEPQETFEGVVEEILGELDHGNIGREAAVRQVVEAAELVRAELATLAGSGIDAGDPESVRRNVLQAFSTGAISLQAAERAFAEREEQLRTQYAEQYAGNLYDTFASMVQVATGFDGVIPEALAKTLMVGIEPPPASEALARLSWFAEAEGRLRYLKADMMMKAREI